MPFDAAEVEVLSAEDWAVQDLWTTHIAIRRRQTMVDEANLPVRAISMLCIA